MLLASLVLGLLGPGFGFLGIGLIAIGYFALLYLWGFPYRLHQILYMQWQKMYRHRSFVKQMLKTIN